MKVMYLLTLPLRLPPHICLISILQVEVCIQVTLYQRVPLLLCMMASGGIFSLLIETLTLVLSLVTSPFFTLPNLVLSPLKIFTITLMFRSGVPWVTSLVNTLALRLWTTLFPLFGNVKPPSLPMNRVGWCTDSIVRISLQFCKGALILFIDDHLF